MVEVLSKTRSGICYKWAVLCYFSIESSNSHILLNPFCQCEGWILFVFESFVYFFINRPQKFVYAVYDQSY